MKSVANEEKYKKLMQEHLKQTLQSISENEKIYVNNHSLKKPCNVCKKMPVLPTDRLLDNSLTAIAKSNSSFSMSHRCNCKDSDKLKEEPLTEVINLNQDV